MDTFRPATIDADGMSCKHFYNPATCLFCRDEEIARLREENKRLQLGARTALRERDEARREVQCLRNTGVALTEENERLKERLKAESARADAMRDAHSKDALSLEQRLTEALAQADCAREAHAGQQRNTLAFMRERDDAIEEIDQKIELIEEAERERDEAVALLREIYDLLRQRLPQLRCWNGQRSTNHEQATKAL